MCLSSSSPFESVQLEMMLSGVGANGTTIVGKEIDDDDNT